MSEDVGGGQKELGLELSKGLSFGEIRKLAEGEFALRHVSSKERMEREAREGFFGDALSLGDVSAFSSDPHFKFKVAGGRLSEEERRVLEEGYRDSLESFLRKSIGLDVLGEPEFVGFLLSKGTGGVFLMIGKNLVV